MDGVFFLLIWLGGATIHTCLELRCRRRGRGIRRQPLLEIRNREDRL
ncbi:MAG: hypothetical protein ACK5PS_07125 [Desulfopila sp.]